MLQMSRFFGEISPESSETIRGIFLQIVRFNSPAKFVKFFWKFVHENILSAFTCLRQQEEIAKDFWVARNTSTTFF